MKEGSFETTLFFCFNYKKRQSVNQQKSTTFVSKFAIILESEQKVFSIY